MRFIGGKNLLKENIKNVIAELPDVHTVMDIFAGSSVVGSMLKNDGYKVVSNDFLYFSYVLSRGSIGLKTVPNFANIGDALGYLNTITVDKVNHNEKEFFVLNNFSDFNGGTRLYFQQKNALKIDLIRLQIEDWKREGVLSDDEYFYLLASLISAVPYVANITGVFAAYLKYWDKRTNNDIELLPIDICGKYKASCFNQDYHFMLKKKVDLIYADPPYNSREYLPNYHVLETIARYDYPELRGVTGMRSYENQKSVFCKKATVKDAFEALLRDCNSRYVLISYNNEGLLPADELRALCDSYSKGKQCRLFEYDYRRYKNKIPNNKEGLKELLYLVEKE